MHHIGIIGFGGAGLAQFDHFRHLPNCQVTAIFDPKIAGLNRAKNLDKIIFCTQNLDLFFSSGIDIVAICSPDKTHADFLEKSLRHGKHVICEKPLTDSLQGINTILTAHRRYPDLVIGVQHQMRFLPLVEKIKTIIARGELGAISYIETHYIHNLTGRANRYDNWRFQDRATPLIYSGCHAVDLTRYLLGDEPIEVMGMANHLAFRAYPESDLNVILLRFRSGTIAKVTTAFAAARPADYSIRLYGSKKSIENNLLFSSQRNRFSFIHRPFFHTLKDENYDVRRWANVVYEDLPAVILDRIAAPLEQAIPLHGEHAISGYPLRLYEHGYAVRKSLEDFMSAIDRHTPLRCSVIDSAKTVAVCIAGVQAYRTGKAVTITPLKT